MKSSPLYFVAALGILAFWWYNRQNMSNLDAIPINQTPAEQQVINALLPTVDNNGNIINPVNENIIHPYLGG